MAAIRDSFADLERYRLQLEDNVTQLRKSLHHWQTWEAEYEGLKEEILALGEKHTEAQLTQVGNDYEGTVLNDQEVKELFNDKNGGLRSGKQVVHLITRRLDYVQENVKSASKQLESAEQKLAASEVLSQPDVRDEEGLPLTEIREELDEDGNVISSSAIRAGDKAPQVAEALRKAGVEDLPDVPKHELSENDLPNDRIEELDDSGPTQDQESIAGGSKHVQDGESKESQPQEQARKGPPDMEERIPLGRKKSVSFAEGTKTEDSKISRKRQPHPLFAKSKPTPYVSTTETIADVKAKTPEGQLSSLLHAEADILAKAGISADADEDEEIVSPVIPKNESPEDAALRRQMLQYNMKQVGSVVAEINLDEQGEGSTPPYSDDDDVDDYDSSLEDEEDEHGRATNIVFSDDYVQQMQALEKKLNASAIRNVGPDPEMDPRPSEVKEKSELAGGQSPSSENSSPTVTIKDVRFAENLDIQEPPKDTSSINMRTIGASGKPEDGRADPTPEKKVSRFKSARAAGTPTTTASTAANSTINSAGPVSNQVKERNPTLTPSGPPNRPLAENVIERPHTATLDPDAPPQEPDELDPALLQQEARTEYHRHRNRMIYRQGGFLPQVSDGEEEDIPLDANGKKVSRFKAARLGRD